MFIFFQDQSRGPTSGGSFSTSNRRQSALNPSAAPTCVSLWKRRPSRVSLHHTDVCRCWRPDTCTRCPGDVAGVQTEELLPSTCAWRSTFCALSTLPHPEDEQMYLTDGGKNSSAQLEDSDMHFSSELNGKITDVEKRLVASDKDIREKLKMTNTKLLLIRL